MNADCLNMNPKHCFPCEMTVPIPYKASLTREPFLFHELVLTAQLYADGKTSDEIVREIVTQNLFQYPTEKSIQRMAKTCIQRLDRLNDMQIVKLLATGSSTVARQVALYAFMKESRLVHDVMISVIGEKYSCGEISFGKIDINTFFLQLQEQDPGVASWSVSTIEKIKQVILKTLVECEYLDTSKSNRLNYVILSPVLERFIRERQELDILPAFNCFI